MNPEKENALNESLAMTKLTIDLLNQKAGKRRLQYSRNLLGYVKA